MTRRDLCHFTGQRAAKLSAEQAARAWLALAQSLQDLGERDVPKWKDVLQAIRLATIVAKVEAPSTPQEEFDRGLQQEYVDASRQD